ncbi:hypothetical protein JE024_11730 [Streptomyces zhihengii]|uniref:Uncharacterized protein n=1 Tax=Streptomyces zhihengii TaxID=1818004 RepID=A0ABS2UPR0_9ACTN|nr:hypothetical protein [Streptomyces zhihengii]MBM9619388.1 hypothetical protein [Streptomyces zhihengii]
MSGESPWSTVPVAWTRDRVSAIAAPSTRTVRSGSGPASVIASRRVTAGTYPLAVHSGVPSVDASTGSTQPPANRCAVRVS